jgi:DNA-binding XRE family transcriptional regulator
MDISGSLSVNRNKRKQPYKTGPAQHIIKYCKDYMISIQNLSKHLWQSANTDDDSVPREVPEKAILEDMPLIKAWRLYLGLTQKEVAKKAGITQAALSQMERAENTNRSATGEKLAAAMGLFLDQVQE